MFKRLALDIAWACKGVQSYDLNCVPAWSNGYCPVGDVANEDSWLRVSFRIRREGIFQELGTKTALILWITGRFEKRMLKWAKNIRLQLQGKKYEMGYEKVWYPSVDLIATYQHVRQSTLAEQKV